MIGNYIKLMMRYSPFYGVCLFTELISRRILFSLFNFKCKLMGITHVAVTLFNGKKMLLEVIDRGLSHDLLFDPEKHREEYASSFIIDYFKNQNMKTFVDVGCNLGYYSILLSDYFEKIIGVEPVKSSADVCLFNAKLNNFDNKFTLIEGAVGLQSGTLHFDDKASKNLVRVSESSSGTECKSYTINEIVNNEKIDFMKMDIEGYEYNLIVEGKEIFFINPPKVFFLEIHFDLMSLEQAEQLLLTLHDNNYYVKRAFSEVKVKYKWLGIFSGLYKWFIVKFIMRNRVGELCRDVDIKTFIDDEKDIMSCKHGAIEFIFERNV